MSLANSASEGHSDMMSKNVCIDNNVQIAQPPSTSEIRAWPIHGVVPKIDRSLRPCDRLMQLRIAAGFPSASAGSRAIGVSNITYQHHENGTRGISRKMASFYAGFFKVPAGLLLYGETPVVTIDVPIVGVINDGGKVGERMSPSQYLPETTPAPPFVDAELLALVVISDELYPAYRPGDVVFFDLLQEIDDNRLDGRECIIELTDGTRLLRVIHRQANGLFTLVTYNTGKPTVDASLAGATPIMWVQRGAYPDAERTHSAN